MKLDAFLATVSAVFIVVASAHLIRVILGFGLVIAGWPVPLWVNTVAFLIAGALAAWGIKLKGKQNS